MIRSHLIKALYENLLGPSNGIDELVQEPFLKYELGILNSYYQSAVDLEDHAVIDSEVNPDPADIKDESLSVNGKKMRDAGMLHRIDTDLMFKIGTVSLGLYFVLEGENPKFKVCLTWARYKQDEALGSASRMFRRCPNFYVTDAISATSDTLDVELKSKAGKGQVTKPGVWLHVTTSKIQGSNRWIVRVFLVNKTKYTRRLKEGERVFQPQIRVVAVNESDLVDLDVTHGILKHKDYEKDDLLYRKSHAKARGYMCAAVWHDVDPEKDPDGDIGGISWPDSRSVPEDVRTEFTWPLVRTEYLPLYAVLQPDLQPDQSEDPRFNAHKMSLEWDPEAIENRLGPLVADFSKWIDLRRKDLSVMHLGSGLEEIGHDNLDECGRTCDRIRAGITFLKSNEKARAAFCLMNAVMNDKRRNEAKEDLKWREFQMAFMVQSLRGVSGESEDDRDRADILWFPTGGGKTEAYLGIMIFAIAYRRLVPRRDLSGDGGVSVISRYTLRLLAMQQFRRALGAIVAADMRRIKNWLPDGALHGAHKLTDEHMLQRLRAGMLWGGQRFSIGMWIGRDTTPKDFASVHVRGGKTILNAEGALLPHDRIPRFHEKQGDPAQITSCPACGSVLCLPKTKKVNEPKVMTWVIRSTRPTDELQLVSKGEFKNAEVKVVDDPKFDQIGNAPDGMYFYYLTLKVAPQIRSNGLDRRIIDKWWEETVRPILNPLIQPLESTSPSMPGYFFLQQRGKSRPYDFAIFCTDPECALNRTDWFESVDGLQPQIPEVFQAGQGRSKSAPISAYTIDEQIYAKCPSFLIATVDKFANLPFEPKCASLFGNVDVLHRVYGYGRRSMFESPVRKRNSNEREEICPGDLHDVGGFLPPSLILQDELHLIEGPLGSMVGIYEMGVDILSGNDPKPKYIASSATIKEARSQVGTIFRRNIATFPPMGIDSSDNYFSRIEEDTKCTRDSPGRLYMGMATTKSTVTLPIKAQSIVMSEIFKIKMNPTKYGLPDDDERIRALVDPYWTFVSYFTDLQLLSKFGGYYSENITENVEKWSVEKAYNSESRAPDILLPPGLRLFTLVPDIDVVVSSISVYCTRPSGKIRLALYADGDPVGEIRYKFTPMECKPGENTFVLPEGQSLKIKRKEKVRIAVVNDRPVSFQAVAGEGSLECYSGTGTAPADFPSTYDNTGTSDETIMISINSQHRRLQPDGNVVLYGETTPEDLTRGLDRLERRESGVDSLQTSPVFGTGIDVNRLGIMEVMNQPKTNSGYIQATGRVGRTKPGLVINWLRAGRARDLNHYENFIGYHRMLHRFVEPVTASPFSFKAMDMCLGPIMVSILRNARSVQGTDISMRWVNSDTGPRAMAHPSYKHEVDAVKDALREIVSSEYVAEYRKMDEATFDRTFNTAKARWKGRVRDAAENKSSLLYAERNPTKIPSNNVILGSPNHKDQGLEYAYENTPISLRQTESAAVFNMVGEHVPIRPSQFTTRYGPGALLSGKHTTWVVPSVQDLVRLLHRKRNFNEPNSQGKRGLDKYEIFDSRMERVLNRRLPKKDSDCQVRLFSLPTNSSLVLKDLDNLYECNNLTEWSICYSSHHHHMKILAKTSRGGQVVRCPMCKSMSASGNPDSEQFYTVRYVLACRRGHLGDVDWRYEVHRRNKEKCPGDVFEWSVSGENDDVKISCMGHWEGDYFIRSSCNGYVTYKDLRNRSNMGEMDCRALFAEGGRDSRGCERADGKSLAKMVSKSQMNLRMSIVATTMEIRGYEGVLFASYGPIKQYIDMFMTDYEDTTKENFVRFLEKYRERKIRGFTDKLISQTRDAQEKTVFDTIKRIQASLINDGDDSRNLSELRALEDELSSLENQTRDCGTGPKVGPDDPEPDTRFPIRFQVRGVNFEAMPFDNISVTQVQTGYTREISPPLLEDTPQDDQSDMLRIGKPVRQWSRYRDESRNVWHIASQLIGEGIFIHLDPGKHDDGYDVLGQSSESFQTWERIHSYVKDRCKESKESDKENSEQVDALEMESMLTDPLFVWWHSFAHELISQLAIDSGFMGVSLGERVYCIERDDGSHLAGVLIYATSPGADGTLGGLTSLVDEDVLPRIVKKTLHKIAVCSNDPLCWDRKIHEKRRTGSACHACLMNSETSCSYRNKFLDRNLVGGSYDENLRGS